jgi:sodium-coupled neutral amino acid transporter 11
MTQAGRQNGKPVNPHGEDRGLLTGDDFDDDNDLGVLHHAGDDAIIPPQDKDGHALAALDSSHGASTPRSANRVRFDLTPEVVGVSRVSGEDDGRYSSSSDRFDMDAEDQQRGGSDDYNRHHHRVPLLTDMEAPSVAVANSWDAEGTDDSDWAEQQMRRPKSGMSSAFMNMANSIIGAGIIGQPYAMRQAGLVSGTLLLLGLTVLIDWTICLIVINSKLSGTSNFQGTVEYCFGKPGLIAISIAQWVFAFGGMVAFGVIVGDTIPHVLLAVWPGLPDIPVIGLLTNRRVAITIFCMGVSYPLTLYRDIAKVRRASFEDVSGTFRTELTFPPCSLPRRVRWHLSAWSSLWGQFSSRGSWCRPKSEAPSAGRS